MIRQKLVLDFDGTLTDVDRNFPLYSKEYARMFSDERGLDYNNLNDLVDEAKNRIRRDPSRGWVHNGIIVAPATADPMVLHLTAYQDVCDQLAIPVDERDKLLDRCFKTAYAKCPTTFRDGIEDFLSGVQKRYDVRVVTNSSTAHVKNALEEIGFKDIEVFGDARKYVVDQDWSEVPKSKNLEGSPRAVLLRRRHYANVLDLIGTTPEDIAMGDIYELDLALPEHRGMRIIQMGKDYTPGYEVKHMTSHPRGKLVRSLEEAGEALGLGGR